MVNCQGLSKAETLCALYNKAKVQGMGFLQAIPGDMSLQEANELITELKENNYRLFFDYVHGRVIKVDLSADNEFDEYLYDRDNGKGAAEKAILKYIEDKKHG